MLTLGYGMSFGLEIFKNLMNMAYSTGGLTYWSTVLQIIRGLYFSHGALQQQGVWQFDPVSFDKMFAVERIRVECPLKAESLIKLHRRGHHVGGMKIQRGCANDGGVNPHFGCSVSGLRGEEELDAADVSNLKFTAISLS